MKLYTHQAACSLSPHIISRELGLDVEIIRVDPIAPAMVRTISPSTRMAMCRR